MVDITSSTGADVAVSIAAVGDLRQGVGQQALVRNEKGIDVSGVYLC